MDASTFSVVVSAVATVATAIFTFIYVRLTNKYVKLTNQILQTNQMANIDDNRPFVVVSLPSRDDMVYLVIQNIGKSPAYNVEITIEPSLTTLGSDDKQLNSDKLLNLSFIPPQFELHNMVCTPVEVIDKLGKLDPFKISISYKDFRKLSFKEEYFISLDSYIYGGKIRQYTDQHYFNKIAKNLEKLNDLKDIAKKLNVIADSLDDGKEKFFEDGTPIKST